MQNQSHEKEVPLYTYPQACCQTKQIHAQELEHERKHKNITITPLYATKIIFGSS